MEWTTYMQIPVDLCVAQSHAEFHVRCLQIHGIWGIDAMMYGVSRLDMDMVCLVCISVHDHRVGIASQRWIL